MAHLSRCILSRLLLNKNCFNLPKHTLNLQTHVNNVFNPNQKWSVRNYSGAYEGDGKSTVTLLNDEADVGLMINSYSQMGFRLNNNVFVLGPMAIFPRTVLSWNVESFEEINEKSLRLVTLLEPKVDLLILGVGDAEVNPAFSKRIMQFMAKYKLNVEILKTEAACATFNFLNAESRMVAALMIPPIHLRVNENDLMRRQRRGNLYELEDDEMFGSPKEQIK